MTGWTTAASCLSMKPTPRACKTIDSQWKKGFLTSQIIVNIVIRLDPVGPGDVLKVTSGTFILHSRDIVNDRTAFRSYSKYKKKILSFLYLVERTPLKQC